MNTPNDKVLQIYTGTIGAGELLQLAHEELGTTRAQLRLLIGTAERLHDGYAGFVPIIPIVKALGAEGQYGRKPVELVTRITGASNPTIKDVEAAIEVLIEAFQTL